jgi:hypothetical protein
VTASQRASYHLQHFILLLLAIFFVLKARSHLISSNFSNIKSISLLLFTVYCVFSLLILDWTYHTRRSFLGIGIDSVIVLSHNTGYYFLMFSSISTVWSKRVWCVMVTKEPSWWTKTSIIVISNIVCNYYIIGLTFKTERQGRSKSKTTNSRVRPQRQIAFRPPKA